MRAVCWDEVNHRGIVAAGQLVSRVLVARRSR
jgi:hypothetical protein